MPFTEEKRTRIPYICVITATLFWCTLIVTAPLLMKHSPKTSALIRLFFAPICHQEAERSFLILDQPLAVCARCSGIYIGFLVGLLAFPIIRRKLRYIFPRRMFILAVIPTATEFGLVRLELIPDNTVIRAMTGFILGAIIGSYIMNAFIEIIQPEKVIKLRTDHG